MLQPKFVILRSSFLLQFEQLVFRPDAQIVRIEKFSLVLGRLHLLAFLEKVVLSL